MTIPHFGRVTPLQSDILNLGGVLTDVPKEFVTEQDRIDAMHTARRSLIRETGMDFGYDLTKWHEFLLSSEPHKGEYTFHYAWKAVREKVAELSENEERIRLAELAAAADLRTTKSNQQGSPDNLLSGS